jgi:hypothetical protein
MKRVFAATLIVSMMEVSALADRASFMTNAVGAAPDGWTATMTGQGKPKWAVEDDATAPSKSKVVKQSGNATYPLLLKDGASPA